MRTKLGNWLFKLAAWVSPNKPAARPLTQKDINDLAKDLNARLAQDVKRSKK